MKIAVAVVISIFIVFMSVVFIGGFIQEQSVQPRTDTPREQRTTNTRQEYTESEVATHDSVNDCWLIINNNVYDVTAFLGQHPGGASTIIPYCGKEATQAFDTQDRGSRGGHSSSATAMLEEYLIGVLK